MSDENSCNVGNLNVSLPVIIVILLFILSLVGVRSIGQFFIHLIIFALLAVLVWWLVKSGHKGWAWFVVAIVVAIFIFSFGVAAGFISGFKAAHGAQRERWAKLAQKIWAA